MTEKNTQQSQFSEAFQNILQEFGTSVPQISMLVAILIGTFGLPEYFNAGVWTVVATLSFALVYVFKRQISSRIIRVSICLLVFLILSFSFGIGLIRLSLYMSDSGSAEPDGMNRVPTIREFMKGHVNIATAYLAATISIPLAILIVSYKKQEALYGLVYPPKINQAIEEHLVKSTFYKKNVQNIVKFSEVTKDSVILDTNLIYEVVNRSDESKEWVAKFTTYNKETEFIKVLANQNEVFVPKGKTLNGCNISQIVKGRGSVQIEFQAKVKYGLNDFELYTTYHQATDLSLTVINPFREIEIQFEVLYRHQHNPVRQDDKIVVRLDEGLLPYQGVKMFWRQMKNNG